MRRCIKYMTGFMMALLLSFGVMSMSVSATEERDAVSAIEDLDAVTATVRTGNLGDHNGIKWSYNESTKTLTVTGEDSGLYGIRYRSPFESICSDVESILLQDCKLKGSVQSLFDSLTHLKHIDFKNFDTSEVTNMCDMFYDCSNLTNLDVSGFNTSKVTDMSGMFFNCNNLTSLDVSGFDTSKVTKMDSMFFGCITLTSLDVSSFDTSNVTDMYAMFCGCMGLKSLDVGGFDTSDVIDMGDMFLGCCNLTTLDVSCFKTSNVTNMYAMFCGCTGLKSLNVSGFDTANVFDMNSMFFECSSLTNLDIGSFNTSNVIDMGEMMSKCNKLNAIYTPKTMKDGQTIEMPVTLMDSKGNKVSAITKRYSNMWLKKGKVATPTITKSGDKLVIQTATEGATIYYTTDGSSPTIANGIKVNASTVTVDTFSGHLKAIAVKEGYFDSDMGRLTMVTPTQESNVSFAVKGVFGGRNVTFNSDLKGAKIYYSSTTSTLTTKDKCVNVGETILFENFYGTIYARTYKDGQWGNVCRLILKIPVVNTPTISVDSKGYATIRTTTPSSYLYYTTDGSTPSMTNGKKVSSPYIRVYVGKGKTVKAVAVRSCFTNSKVAMGK